MPAASRAVGRPDSLEWQAHIPPCRFREGINKPGGDEMNRQYTRILEELESVPGSWHLPTPLGTPWDLRCEAREHAGLGRQGETGAMLFQRSVTHAHCSLIWNMKERFAQAHVSHLVA